MRFDNSRPNIVLLTDRTDVISLDKTLGVYKIAHSLRRAGYEVQVIQHLSVFSISELCEILSALVSRQTLFVGVSDFFYKRLDNYSIKADTGIELYPAEPGSLLPHGKQFNHRIRSAIIDKNPNCKLVIGGPSAVDTVHNKDYDFIVSGYGEVSVVNLAQHLQDPTIPLQQAYRSVFGPVVLTNSKAEGYDFQHCDFAYADNDGILPGETLMLEISRGCIFRCAFCSFLHKNKSKLDYIRDMDLLRQEIVDNWQRFGITRYKFSDDTVNDSVEKCKMLSEMLADLPFELEWWGYIRLDLLAAHPQTISYLFDHGLRAAFFGIETLNAKSASAIGKGGNRQRQIETLKEIKQRYGHQVSLHGSFIYGLPHESVESMQQTTEWLFSDDCPLDTWAANPLRIRNMPNTGVQSGGFFSEIELNYKKYGYEALDVIDWAENSQHQLFGSRNGLLLWKNQYTNYFEVEKMYEDTVKRKQVEGFMPDGLHAFDWASIDHDLARWLNRLPNDNDYHYLDKKKMLRVYQYRKFIQTITGVPLSTKRLPLTCSDLFRTSFLIS